MQADKAHAEIDVFHVELKQLGNAHAGGVEHLEHSAVAQALAVKQVGLRQQQLHLFLGENLRNLTGGLVRLDTLERVVDNAFKLHQVLVKGVQCGGVSRDGGRGFSLRTQLIEVVDSQVGRDLVEVGNSVVLGKGKKAKRVMTVGLHRVFGSIFYGTKIMQKALNVTNHDRLLF